MNDQQLRDQLNEAYQVQPLSDTELTNIRRAATSPLKIRFAVALHGSAVAWHGSGNDAEPCRARQSNARLTWLPFSFPVVKVPFIVSPAKPTTRWIARFAMAGAAVGACGFMWPVGQANWIAFQAARKLSETPVFEAHLWWGGIQEPETSIRLFVAGDKLYGPMTSGFPQSKAYMVEDKTSASVVYPESRFRVQMPPTGIIKWLLMPDQLIEKLRQFRLDGRVIDTPEGRHLRWTDKDQNTIEIDAQTERITRVDLHLKIDPQGTQNFPKVDTKQRARYFYPDPSTLHVPKLDGRLLRLAHFEDGLRDVPTIPSRSIQLGRDKLNVYQWIQNSNGEIFVLYTCDGYHDDPQNEGPWLRVASNGGEWHTEVINFFRSKWQGHFLKAQVFVPPHGNGAGPYRLFTKMHDWEFVRQERPGFRTGDDPVTKTIAIDSGDNVPKVSGLAPAWLFYAFDPNNDGWVNLVRRRYQILDAREKRDWKTVIRLGTDLENHFPPMFLGYPKDLLQTDLAIAYRGTGQMEFARHYAKLARADESSPVDRRWKEQVLAGL